MAKFKLRWTHDDPSDAIILTYHSSWEKKILQAAFSVELRKTGPTNLMPDCMYAYVTDPVRAIIARMSVTEFGHMSIAEALKESSHTLFSEHELRRYAAGRVGLYYSRLGPVRIAKTRITFQHLSQEYDYWPSSNFFPLSETGKTVLDSLGEFGE